MTDPQETLFTWINDIARKTDPTLKVMVYDERGFLEHKLDGNTIFVAYSRQDGQVAGSVTSYQCQLHVLSEAGDFERARAVLNELVAEKQLSFLPGGGYVVFGMPEVTTNFVQADDNYRAMLYLNATMVISPGIYNPEIRYKNEYPFLVSFTADLVAGLDPLPLESTGVAKSKTRYFTRGFGAEIYCDTGIALVRDCLALWKGGTADTETEFTIGVSLDGGNYEDRSYVLKSLSYSYGLTGLPSVVLAFAEADDGEQ